MMGTPQLTPVQKTILGKMSEGWRISIEDGRAIIRKGEVSEIVHPLLLGALQTRALITREGGLFVLTDEGKKVVEGPFGE